MAEHNELGKIGESVAKTFLMKHGFAVIEANYRTKYGELDIVAKKDNKLHFVEVKSVKVRNVNDMHNLSVRPEDNLTQKKWFRFSISVENYLKHRNIHPQTLWQIDLACVYLDTETKQGKVVLMENIHKE
ncbi:MAG: hypothetical protein RIQ41_558 [Candidatus Parcubacteria bacterium]